tara:strand:+ start:833 stop:3145 length:2313 start_codon:yes stop_codon:yes gene_type:complete
MFSIFLKKVNKILKLLLMIMGFLSILSLIIILFYGDTSHMRRNVMIDTMKSMFGIGTKYEAFVANTPKKIFKAYYLGVINSFKNHNIPELEILINFKNLKILEAQREKRVDSNLPLYAKARIKIINNDETNLVKVKIRSKGDREIHKIDMNQMSYKIDVRGDDYVFGMEEMSIQKPIARNYGWELLFHEVAKKENLLNLKIIPINLLRNSEKLGIFVIEEGFSKELIEKQGRKNGPIIGIEETLNQIFPFLTYDYYSEKKWSTESPDIYRVSKENLELLKKNFDNEDYKISDYFDVDLWAKYFAIIDLLKAYHAAVPKSVKLYFNPSTGLYEPIAFDGHIGSGYDEFIFLDFYKNNQIKCGYVCSDKDWLKVFFNKKNDKFIKLYIKYLDEFTSKKYLKKIKNIITKKIEPFNQIIYSEFPKSDRVYFKGFLPYYFDPIPIYKRASLIKIKIKSFKNEILTKMEYDNFDFIQNQIVNKNYKTLSDLGDINKLKEIYFSEGLWLLNDLEIINKPIILEKNTILYLTGNNYFEGSKKKLKIEGNGMITQMGGSFKAKNIKFLNLKNVKVEGLNWSGSINAINSIVNIKNVDLVSSEGEDAINLVGSNSYIENLKIYNSQSDAIDVDFGKLIFTKIYCFKALNDCLDTSGAFVEGNYLYGEKIGDKLASFGEKSNIKIKAVAGKNIKIGVVSKDESIVVVKNLNLENTKIYGGSYIKKPFFNEALLNIDTLENFTNEKKIKDIFFNSDKNILIVNKKNLQANKDSIEILNLLN